MMENNNKIQSKKIPSNKYININGEYIPEQMIETKEHVIDWIYRSIDEINDTIPYCRNDEEWENELDNLIKEAHRLSDYLEKLKIML